jgi:hypothetical protein
MKMGTARFTARIGSFDLARDVSYELLVKCLLEHTVRAAMARVADESVWEYDELRRKGLDVVEIVRDGRALWNDAACFEAEALACEAAGDEIRFHARNELDPPFFARLDADLRKRWKRAGYETPCLRHGMKRLFTELEADAAERAAAARERLIDEIVAAGP